MFPGVTNAQTPALQTQALGFNYVTADLAVGVTSFEMKIDTGAYVSVGMPTTADDASTPVGSHTYKVAIPTLTLGNHTVVFRACSTGLAGCSADSPSFGFKLVVIVSPTGTRIIGGDIE